MKKIEPKKIIAYWKKTAEHDYDTMRTLFKIKRYPESLFFGHIVLEKILKALVVHHTGEHSPFTHNLIKLQGMANLNLSKEECKFLGEMNEYNTRTRYPDYKLLIYKRCTKKFTKTIIDKIISLYSKLCQRLK